MAKYEPYPRAKLRGLRRDWLRKNRLLVAGLGGGALGLIAVETALVSAVIGPSSLRWWLIGVLQATVVGLFLHLIYIGPLVHEREAIWQLRGAWGEENTRDALRRARRKHLIWDWVDSIQLQIGDMDHFVVSRRGGLVVVDSKWRSATPDVAEMAKAASQKNRAEGVARSRFASDRTARHRDRVNALTVTPVIVVWGSAQHDVPDGARVDGIDFVAGRRFLEWLAALDGNHVDRKAAAEIVREFKEFRATAGAASGAG